MRSNQMKDHTDPTRATDAAHSAIEQAIMHCEPVGLRVKAIEGLHLLKETEARRQRVLEVVQEALSQLRLDVKYLIFDVEATRRERDELKRRLGE